MTSLRWPRCWYVDANKIPCGHVSLLQSDISEVEITCSHRSNSARFITMTDHNCKWSVGMTDRW